MSKIEVATVSLLLKTKMKQAMRYFYNCLTALLMLCMDSTTLHAIDYTAYSTENTVGTNYVSADSTIMTYARPSEYTLLDGSPRFNVLINGEAYTGLYDANNAWGGNVSFGYFDFKDGTPVEVVISCRKSLGNYHLLPAGAEVSNVEKITDKILKFTISKANQNVTLVLDGDYQTGDVLHLFCNDIIKAPNVASKEGYSYDRKTRTYYFGPGYYDLNDKFGGTLMVAGARSIYLAGGAVVRGSIGLNSTGGKIYGHGMVVSNGGSELNCSYNTGGVVDGIICHKYKESGWQTTYSSCSNIKVTNMKVIAPYGGSSDGMDFTACSGMQFDNCFVRAMDDCIAIKGLAADSLNPADCQPEKDIHFTRMQLWSDANNAFGIGAETLASSFENISFTSSDILSSWDDPSHHEELNDRAAINITSLHGSFFHNIRIDSIRVNRCVRLIQMGFQDSFWFGTLLGNMSWEGGMYDIHMSNISSPNDIGSASANDVLLRGWAKDGTPTKYIHDIWFNNVMIEGSLLDGWNNANLKTNNTDDQKLVYDIHFNETSGIAASYPMTPKAAAISSDWYTLQGERLLQKPIQPGIYIHGGRKTVIH